MLTLPIEKCNIFNQKIYDNIVDKFSLNAMECTCGHKGCLIYYGHYKRNVKFNSQRVVISIQRVFCKFCHATHALLPAIIVPYSQITLEDQQEIIADIVDGVSPEEVLNRNYLIDENNVKHIIRNFRRHWEQRLLSLGLSLHGNLSSPCLHFFRRQFMQIHRTRNKLCFATNIT